jgi:hypothetical protein
MNNDNTILCLDELHEKILISYLSDIQDIIDDITIEDEKYDSFLEIMSQIIVIHNENGTKSYLDGVLRDNWLYSLPNMVYWASLGYISSLGLNKEDLTYIIKKISNRLSITIETIKNMSLISPLFNDKTLLN